MYESFIRGSKQRSIRTWPRCEQRFGQDSATNIQTSKLVMINPSIDFTT